MSQKESVSFTLRKFWRYNKASLGELLVVPLEILGKHQQGKTCQNFMRVLSVVCPLLALVLHFKYRSAEECDTCLNRFIYVKRNFFSQCNTSFTLFPCLFTLHYDQGSVNRVVYKSVNSYTPWVMVPIKKCNKVYTHSALLIDLGKLETAPMLELIHTIVNGKWVIRLTSKQILYKVNLSFASKFWSCVTLTDCAKYGLKL